MPPLFVPEDRWGPGSWGANHPLTVARADPSRAQRGAVRLLGLLAREQSRGRVQDLRRRRDRHGPGRLPVQQRQHGRRPRLRGLPGAAGEPDPPPSAYTNGVVTPHAAFLGLRYAPHEALENLRRLERDFRDMYGRWGFRDAVNVDTGGVSEFYLSLDQGMVMAAIGNALGDDVLRRAFVTKATERNVRPVIGVEEFNSDPRGCTITGTAGQRPAARYAPRRRDLRARRRRPDRRRRRR